jgi:ribonucleoside-triphosphate reductase
MTEYKMSPYNTFIAKSRYSRYLDDKGRREHWSETVARYFDFMTEHLKTKQNYTLPPELRKELETAVVNLEVVPSMRAVMTAGPALERQNVAAFNCSYLPIDDPKAFDEAMYILLCGTGVGFSVEQQYVSKLPEVPEQLFSSQTTIVVSDSKEGWAKSLRQLIALLYSGEVPRSCFWTRTFGRTF